MLRFLITLTTLIIASTEAKAMHFTENPGIMCGSEATIRQHAFEWANGIPYTVFNNGPAFKGSAWCYPAVISLLGPKLILIERKNSFCAIRIMITENGIDRRVFWVNCLSIVDD